MAGYLKKIHSVGMDYRYSDVKVLIQNGNIKTFQEILDRIPKTQFCIDLNMKTTRFTQCIHDPTKFSLLQLFTMARFLKIDEKLFMSMVIDHWRENGAPLKSARGKDYFNLS